MLIVEQVSKPSERLGVPPVSSPARLRDHPFFVGPKLSEGADKKEGEEPPPEPPSTTYIDWKTLWTVGAPEMQAGLKKRAPDPMQELDREKIEQEIWSRFEEIHLVDT